MATIDAMMRGLQTELRTQVALYKAYRAIAASSVQVRRVGRTNSSGARAGVLLDNSARHLGVLKARIAATRAKLLRLQSLRLQRRQV